MTAISFGHADLPEVDTPINTGASGRSVDRAGRPIVTEHAAKSYAGEIKRDFDAIFDARRTNDERLFLLLKHSRYSLSDAERKTALETLARVEGQRLNVYTMASALGRAGLGEVEEAIRRGFKFKDKHTMRWGLIYALVAQRESGSSIAELGFTEETTKTVVKRCRDPRSAMADTRLGRFLNQLDAEKLEGHLVMLESHFGSLDHMGDAKDEWRGAGERAGVEFPQRRYLGDSSRRIRSWPSAEAVEYQRSVESKIR